MQKRAMFNRSVFHPFRSRALHRRAARALVLASILPGAIITPAWAADALRGQSPKEVRDLITEQVRQRVAHLPGNPVIEVDANDVSRHPACDALRVASLANTQLRSRLSVRVDCEGPSRWAAYIPVRLAVNGSYVSTARVVQAGERLGPGQLTLQQGDLIGLPDDTVFRLQDAVGHTAAVRLRAGQPVRAGSLRPPGMITHGQKVRVIVNGSGFVASSEGEALGSAAPGETLRVRTPSGQIISGVVTPEGTVEISM